MFQPPLGSLDGIRSEKVREADHKSLEAVGKPSMIAQNLESRLEIGADHQARESFHSAVPIDHLAGTPSRMTADGLINLNRPVNLADKF